MQFVRNAPIVGPHDGVVVISAHRRERLRARRPRPRLRRRPADRSRSRRRGTGAQRRRRDRGARARRDLRASATRRALLAVAMVVAADGRRDDHRARRSPWCRPRVRHALEAPGVESVPPDARSITVVGAGPAAVTAARGCAEAPRGGAAVSATGGDAEYLLHGGVCPLTPRITCVALGTPDEDGFVAGVAAAAEAEGIGVTRVTEVAPAPHHPRADPLDGAAPGPGPPAGAGRGASTRTRRSPAAGPIRSL